MRIQSYSNDFSSPRLKLDLEENVSKPKMNEYSEYIINLSNTITGKLREIFF